MSKIGVVSKYPEAYTVDGLRKLFPKKKATITEETVEYINAAKADEGFNVDDFIKTLVDYQSIMYDSKASLMEYMRAIKFCAYLETEDSLVGAYRKARYDDEFVMRCGEAKSGTPEYNAMSSAASRYRKSKLVVQILAQSDMPLYLMFQGFRYKAVAVLAKEMNDAPYARDRIAAAKALLESVKAPENVKVELDIGVKENSAIQSLNEQLAEFASKSMEQLQNGKTDLKTLGNMKAKSEEIIDAEVENV